MIVVAVCTFRESIAADITLVIIRRCVNTVCESILTDVALVIVIAVYTYAHNRVTHYTFMLFFLTDSQCLAARVTLVVAVLILAFREGDTTGVAFVIAVLIGALTHLLGAHVALVVGI